MAAPHHWSSTLRADLAGAGVCPMRVQLIWFNLNATPKMSLGLALMARELTQGGHAIGIMHLNEVLGMDLDMDRICAEIADFRPDLLALSFGRNHVPHARRLLPHLAVAHDEGVRLGHDEEVRHAFEPGPAVPRAECP